MKRIRFWTVFPAMLGVLLLVGCGSHDPVAGGIDEGTAPAVQQQSDSHSAAGNRVLWGLWKISISADRQTITVVPDRVGALHFNVVRLIEVAPCSDCLRIKNVKGTPDGLSADVILIHPFPGLLQYTGFDVRGIFISGARYTFPVSGRKIAWGDDVARMLNSDGYTHLFNPTNFPYTSPPILGYIPGHKAPGGDLSATLNPYVAYEQDKPRCVFMPGTVSTRTVFLYLPPGPLEFGYAVDASWFPAGVEVTDPVKDFPPQANAFEAYRISVQVGEEPCPIARDEEIRVEVYDHQGLDTIKSVTVEAPDLFSGEVELTYSETTAQGGFVFSGLISNEHAVSKGPHPLVVRVKDTETDGNLGIVDAWQVRPVMAEIGWARTWGGIDTDFANSVAIDASGDIYVTGRFRDIVDFDPGEGDEILISHGAEDIFLSKFNTFGDFLWVRAWGGTEYDDATAVATDGSGGVYVTGLFRDSVDFDPGPGSSEHTSNGWSDVFLSKFSSSGQFEYVRVWGGIGEDQGLDVAVDGSGDAYVTGLFVNTVDFDTGGGIQEYTVEGPGENAFLSKFDSSGSFQWVLIWGDDDSADGTRIAFDTPGFVYVVGHFVGIVDFDPGPGIEEHNSYYGYGVFVSKFDPFGAFQWVRTWVPTSSGGVWGEGIAVSGSSDLYVAGKFHGTVDFDPGPGIVEYSVPGLTPDAYMSKLDTSGNFYWAYRWGANGPDMAYDVVTDGSGNAYVTGSFLMTVDFDPGSEIEERSAYGSGDVYLSKFDSGGDFTWVRTWGSPGWDDVYRLAVDEQDNVFAGGTFNAPDADFDPGPCVDMHISRGGWDAFLGKMPPDGLW